MELRIDFHSNFLSVPPIQTYMYTCAFRLDVDRIFRLEPIVRSSGRYRFYITRPDMLAVSQIADHIQSDNRAREQHDYYIIFVPRKLATCDYILEREGIYGFVRIMEWNLHLIPLDEDLLSLELHDSVPTLYISGNYTMLHSIVSSILNLEDQFGTIPTVHGKGHLATMVWQLVEQMKQLKHTSVIHKEGGSAISELILFDRQCDLVTPLCSQLTYEGILDDVLHIKSGLVEVTKEVTGKQQNVKVSVNAKDPIYSRIRSLHFSSVPSFLSFDTRKLQDMYDKGKSSQSIPALKDFVQKLPELTKKHDSLATHLRVSEQIVRRKREGDFTRQLLFERAILEAADRVQITEYIEECIQRQVNFHIPLRLLCLMSTTSNGIKPKYFLPLKQQYLHSYGHKHLSTFHNLQKMGLIRMATDETLTQTSKTTFRQLAKQLKLVPKDPSSYDVHLPKDMAYVFGGAYKPLSCAAVDHVVRTGGWRGLDDVVKSWSGPAFSHSQGTSQRMDTVLASQAHKVVLVYFIGGCTFSEINALRFLTEKTNCHYIVATTNIIRADSLIDDLV